ncbi:unnamed protein product [Aureobasidium pullulans]|nr:unnamed protein product [Aureobasidium pullulans]
MSFQDSPNLEGKNTRRLYHLPLPNDPEYQDDPEFNSFTTDLSDRLFSLTANISRLSSQVALLGTKRETDRVRERVQDLLEETSASFKDIGDGLKKVQAWHDLGYTQGKLNQEFKASLTEFQSLQRTALEKQRASATAARTALEESGSPTTERSQQQLQQQQQEQLLDFQESLIVEREAEIRNIEQSVGELNELFRDVAHMVHDQGGQLDIISNNVTSTRDDTQGADRELRTASRHQKNARNKMCCLLLILAVILTVVIVAAVAG